jgi:hypothetical protein
VSRIQKARAEKAPPPDPSKVFVDRGPSRLAACSWQTYVKKLGTPRGGWWQSACRSTSQVKSNTVFNHLIVWDIHQNVPFLLLFSNTKNIFFLVSFYFIFWLNSDLLVSVGIGQIKSGLRTSEVNAA